MHPIPLTMQPKATELRRDVELDPLTSLPNRRRLRARLEQEIKASAADNKSVSLLVMDLDAFKEVNHTMGHLVGDELLQQIGQRLSSTLAPPNVLARLGGDEFAIVAPGCGAEDAAVLAAEVLRALEEPFDLNGLRVNVQASIGIALFPDHGRSADNLMQRADMAMYAAKRAKSGYALYSSEQNHNSQRRLLLMGELRRALVQDQLFLVYQPKVNLSTGRTTGVEALIRWEHPQFGVIKPNRFIPLAEKTGLIMPLTLWVIHAALRQCHIWQQLGIEITTAVNLSAWNLQSDQLPEQLEGLLKSCAVDPSRMQLEITESAIMIDPTRALANLKRMRAMGLKFAIDDFGTGYSSLAYLKRLPVSEIKIDKSFVSNIPEDEDDVVIVRSTIDLGHNLGLEVVAEGVESHETLRQLAALKCDAAQGFFMSQPLTDTDLTSWLAESPERLRRLLAKPPRGKSSISSLRGEPA
ncbi:MAG TPA: EAL domain-containing protein [Candidatus Acidoferrales bacterium]|nr:EAL domain-containing protein [Candidatus Acidoferrales bacterium]